jgi:hypothetical protein
MNTPKPIDYAFIISEIEAKIDNDVMECDALQEKILMIDKNLKSVIILPDYTGEKKLEKEIEMRESINYRNTLLGNISVNQKILERYKKVHQTWEEKYSLIYKEAMEGGSKKLIEQARQINNPDINRKLNEYEAGMNDKNRNRDEKAQAYSAFKNLVALYQK